MQLYVQYDKENEKVIAGPQGSQLDDTWVPFIPARDLEERQEVHSRWVEEVGVVLQVGGEKLVPDYAEQRFTAYPELREQFDTLWHDINNGALDKTGKFYSAISEVKETYPKPGE